MADRRSQAIGAAGTALLGLLLWLTPLGQGLVHLSYDLPFAFRVDIYTDEVAIVHLDEASRRELRQASVEKWDRDLHAQFLEKMIAWKAKTVVLALPLEQPATNDPRFVQAVAAFRKVAVGAFRSPLASPRNSEAVVAPFAALQRVALWGPALSGAQTDVVRQHEFEDPTTPPPLSSRAAQLVLGQSPPSTLAPRWIYYYGPPGVFSSFSYADVLQDRLPAEVFSNKVVFVGALGLTNAPSPAGGFRTPYTRWRHARSSVAEIEATRFLNLVRGEWLTRLSAVKEFLLIAGAGALFGWGFGLFLPLRAAGVALVAFMIVTAVALWMMWHQRVWFSWMIVVCAQIPVALGWSALSVTRRLSREMQELEETLATRDADAKPLTAPAAAPMPSPPVQDPGYPAPPLIPNHQLLRCIGRGAYGEVWLARDEIGVFRAVKLVFRNHFKDKTPFEREYRGILQYTPLSRTHHGLVQILHIGRDTTADYFFYVMELADCEHTGRNIDPAVYSPRNLARELDRRGLLPVVECVRLGMELSEALGYLHSRQLVHRDIKPANIIFVNNVPKLADVGLVAHFAEAKRDDKKLGTEGFVPPEGPGTPTADVYSLGKVLCEASLGLAAATSSSPPTVPPQRDGEPGLAELVAIICRACDEDLARRYKSIQEMQADLMVLQDVLARQ